MTFISSMEYRDLKEECAHSFSCYDGLLRFNKSAINVAHMIHAQFQA